MKSSSKRTLMLNRETVRALTGGEMNAVAGGAAVPVTLPKPFPTIPLSCIRCPSGFACPTVTIATMKCGTVRV
jgi:hypothetical protein